MLCQQGQVSNLSPTNMERPDICASIYFDVVKVKFRVVPLSFPKIDHLVKSRKTTLFVIPDSIRNDALESFYEFIKHDLHNGRQL